jgi:hypothetical protein
MSFGVINRFGGAGGLMDDTVCRGGIVQTSRGMCSLARVSTALGVKHLIAQYGLTFTSTCLG